MNNIPDYVQKYCEKFGYIDPLKVNGQYWAYQTGDVIPKPLPPLELVKFRAELAQEQNPYLTEEGKAYIRSISSEITERLIASGQIDPGSINGNWPMTVSIGYRCQMDDSPHQMQIDPACDNDVPRTIIISQPVRYGQTFINTEGIQRSVKAFEQAARKVAEEFARSSARAIMQRKELDPADYLRIYHGVPLAIAKARVKEFCDRYGVSRDKISSMLEDKKIIYKHGAIRPGKNFRLKTTGSALSDRKPPSKAERKIINEIKEDQRGRKKSLHEMVERIRGISGYEETLRSIPESSMHQLLYGEFYIDQ